nr:MAG: hypothetical protein CM15mV30_0900 [uncultured marine virus]
MSEYTELFNLPCLFMKVKRPKTCTVQYYNEKGEDQKFTFDALTSRVCYMNMTIWSRDFTSRVSKMFLIEQSRKEINL